MRETSMNPIWAASYTRGIRLAEEGCPLPYLDALPGRDRFYRRDLYVSQVAGYIESYIIDEGPHTAYAIALRVGTDLPSGAIITDYTLIPPWSDHLINWDYEPRDVLPDYKLHDYSALVKSSRLPGVLNDRENLYRGRAVEGLLCGRAWKPIPESCLGHMSAMMEIILECSGKSVRAPLELVMYGPTRQKYGTREYKRSKSLETGPEFR